MFRPRLAESCSHWGSRSMLFPCWSQWFVSKDSESHMNASFSTSGFSDAFRPGPRPRPCRVTHLATFPVRTRRPRRGDFGGSWVGWLANIPKGCIKLKTQMFRFHVSVSLLDFSEVNGAEKGAGPVGPGWVQLERFKPVNFGILLKSLRWFLQKSTYVEW